MNKVDEKTSEKSKHVRFSAYVSEMYKPVFERVKEEAEKRKVNLSNFILDAVKMRIDQQFLRAERYAARKGLKLEDVVNEALITYLNDKEETYEKIVLKVGVEDITKGPDEQGEDLKKIAFEGSYISGWRENSSLYMEEEYYPIVYDYELYKTPKGKFLLYTTENSRYEENIKCKYRIFNDFKELEENSDEYIPKELVEDAKIALGLVVKKKRVEVIEELDI